MRCTFSHPGQHFEVAGVEVDALADRRQHRLPRARGAMHGKTHPHQVVGDLLDLVFAGVFQHRDNHGSGSSFQGLLALVIGFSHLLALSAQLKRVSVIRRQANQRRRLRVQLTQLPCLNTG